MECFGFSLAMFSVSITLRELEPADVVDPKCHTLNLSVYCCTRFVYVLACIAQNVHVEL